ncbi:Cation:proton antiporter [Candidatus Hepatincolaceae symbiont of Richtersius coronifer]
MLFFITLLLLWFILSGYFSALPLIPGILSLFILIFLVKRSKIASKYTHCFSINLKSFILYLPYLVKEIFISNLFLVKVILTNKISPKIIQVNNNFSTKSATVIFVNSTTLTPGSICIYVDHKVLLVHVLVANKDTEAYFNSDSSMAQRVRSIKKQEN